MYCILYVLVVETDEQCTYFLTVLPVHNAFDGIDYLSNQENNQESDQESDQEIRLLKHLLIPRSRSEILSILGLKNHFDNFKRHIEPLLKKGLIERTIPEKPKDRNQKYRTTEEGRRMIRG